MSGLPAELIALLVVAAIAALLRLEWLAWRRQAAFANRTRESGAGSLAIGPSGDEELEDPDEDLMAIEGDGQVWLPDRHAARRSRSASACSVSERPPLSRSPRANPG